MSFYTSLEAQKLRLFDQLDSIEQAHQYAFEVLSESEASKIAAALAVYHNTLLVEIQRMYAAEQRP